MNTKQRLIAGIVVAILAVLGIGYLWGEQQSSQVLGHGGAFASINFNDAIGSSSSPRTLTNSYGGTSSTVLLTNGLPNISVGGRYTPKSQGSKLYILMERSLDNGSTFVPYGTLLASSTAVFVNTNGSSTTNGTPFILPAGNSDVSTSGTAIGFSFDLTLVGDYIRISAKEDTTSTAGTLYLNAIAESN